MTDAERKALTIIDAGEIFEEGWYDDGDVESGPTGGTYFGYRYGEEVVQLTRNGSVMLYDETNGIGDVIYNSSGYGDWEKWYVGIGAMIANHLQAAKRNAERNGMDFVKTGRHPTEGYYSLEEILRREEALRS